MTSRIEVKNAQEAWDMANKISPGDYDKDEESSRNAGYPIYRNSVEFYDYICDLGDHLEINLKAGNKTINIWIVDEQEEIPELPAKEEIKEAAACQYTFEPEQVQLVHIFASGYKFESEANKAVYKAMQNNEYLWQRHIASDMVEAYCEDKGIERGTIRVISVNHYPKGETEGHYVIEAIVGARVKA